MAFYNAPISWDTTIWHPQFIIVSWHKTLATYDFNELTMLVLLCHAARIRGQVGPKGFHHVEIGLHERRPSTGMSRHHPDLAEAVRRFDDYLPGESPIHYRGPAMLWHDEDATK